MNFFAESANLLKITRAIVINARTRGKPDTDSEERGIFIRPVFAERIFNQSFLRIADNRRAAQIRSNYYYYPARLKRNYNYFVNYKLAIRRAGGERAR